MVSRPAGRGLLLACLLVASGCQAEPSPPAGGPDGGPAAELELLLVAGGPSHGPGEHEYHAGSVLLASLLEQSAGLRTTLVRNDEGWPDDPAVLERAATLVLFTDGNSGHPLGLGDHLEQLRPHIERGMGLVCLHWSVYPQPPIAGTFLDWLGAEYVVETSVNPIWEARFEALPEHATTRGVSPFTLEDEWYYNLKMAPASEGGPLPLLQAVPPDDTRFTADAAAHAGRAETVAWAFTRADGGRSFGLTGAHFHANWAEANLRRLVVNAILWTAGREVPAGGAPVELDPVLLTSNIDE